MLKDVVGVRISKVGNGQEGETFLLQGLRGNYYVKILLNGIPLNPTTTLGMPIAEQLPIQQAERIEIIFGAASAIYGADALAGVINIVTQNPQDNTFFQAGITAGQFGYNHFHFLAGSSIEVGKENPQSLQYTLMGNFSQQNDLNLPLDSPVWNPQNYNSDFASGIPIYTPNYRGTNTSPEIRNLPRMSYTYGVDIRYKDITLSFTEMYRKDHSSLGQSTASYFYYDPETFYGERIRRYAAIYTKNFDKISLLTNISLLNYRLDKQSSFALVFEGGDKGRQYKYAASDDLFAEQLFTYRWNDKFETTAGVSYQFSGNLPKTNDLPVPFNPQNYRPFATEVPVSDTLFGKFGYNPIVFSNLGAFVQGYYNNSKFSAIVGLRYDKQSIYGDSFNPRLALLYKFNALHSLQIAVGRAFKAPTTNNSYTSIAVPVGGTNILYLGIPNPDLQAELSTNFNISWRGNWQKKFYTELNFFQNNIKGLIDVFQVPIDASLYPNAVNSTASSYRNNPNAFALIRGVQAAIRFKEIGKAKMASDLFLTYSQGEELLPVSEEKINTFREMPTWLIQWNISFKPTEKWYLMFRNVLASSWYSRDIGSKADFEKAENFIRGYHTLDFMTSYALQKNFQAYLQIQNILDVSYAGISAYGSGDLLYNPQPKRMIVFGLNFNFR